MGFKDVSNRQITSVDSVPSGVNQTTQATTVVAANSTQILRVDTSSDSQILALWNFLWSVFLDVNDPAYNLPGTGGSSSLTAAQVKLCTVTTHYDWAFSSDSTNKRAEIFLFRNDDTVSHTFYLNYKAYSSSASAAR